ncbi:MAG: NAD-dependent epimerase/dehydratase family protein, partial [bacterium]
DGSCVRDYIHVVDLAEAHVAAAALCEAGGAQDVFNVGTGVGSSVWEVMAAVSAVVGRDVDAQAVPRRAGDPPELVASVDRAAASLDWRARHDLSDMVSSAWSARAFTV